MSGAGPADLLLERGREVESLRAALAGTVNGGGRLALVEGPAGIGKSRLLAELRSAAIEDDVRVLTARGSELEREFPFGVVRQLFESLAAPSSACTWATATARRRCTRRRTSNAIRRERATRAGCPGDR